LQQLVSQQERRPKKTIHRRLSVHTSTICQLSESNCWYRTFLLWWRTFLGRHCSNWFLSRSVVQRKQYIVVCRCTQSQSVSLAKATVGIEPFFFGGGPFLAGIAATGFSAGASSKENNTSSSVAAHNHNL